MRTFGRWLLANPVRLVEMCSGILLLGVATLVWESAASAAISYFLGALLLFLTLHACLNQGRSGR